jgi:hypothetical protein
MMLATHLETRKELLGPAANALNDAPPHNQCAFPHGRHVAAASTITDP